MDGRMYQIKINGIVQGVGFRPFIYKLAIEQKLTGYVLNSTNGISFTHEGNFYTNNRAAGNTTNYANTTGNTDGGGNVDIGGGGGGGV